VNHVWTCAEHVDLMRLRCLSQSRYARTDTPAHQALEAFEEVETLKDCLATCSIAPRETPRTTQGHPSCIEAFEFFEAAQHRSVAAGQSGR